MGRGKESGSVSGGWAVVIHFTRAGAIPCLLNPPVKK
jgi:hypothetical protein